MLWLAFLRATILTWSTLGPICPTPLFFLNVDPQGDFIGFRAYCSCYFFSAIVILFSLCFFTFSFLLHIPLILILLSPSHSFLVYPYSHSVAKRTTVTSMGKLDIGCLTSTPDSSTFYGLDVTSSYDYAVEYKSGSSFVIFKSNANPTSPENLTWSLVSRLYIEDLGIGSLSDYSCAVDANGVFTFFFEDYSSPNIPSGIRYDPNGKADSGAVTGSKGPGTWRSISVDRSHQWERSRINQALQYVDSPSGPLLLHCIIRGNKVLFASYNEATNALNSIGSWYLVRLIVLSSLLFIVPSRCVHTWLTPFDFFFYDSNLGI